MTEFTPRHAQMLEDVHAAIIGSIDVQGRTVPGMAERMRVIEDVAAQLGKDFRAHVAWDHRDPQAVADSVIQDHVHDEHLGLETDMRSVRDNQNRLLAVLSFLGVVGPVTVTVVLKVLWS